MREKERTQIRLGGVRIGMQVAGSIDDLADILCGIARANLRAFSADSELRDDAVRRILSPPCATRCYVTQQGHDCHCPSGIQYTSDPEAQLMEGCDAKDVWNDWRSLAIAHQKQGRGEDDPYVADCDCITPAHLGLAAWIAWMQGKNPAAINGISLGAFLRPEAGFAVGITLPPDRGDGSPRIGHAYSVITSRPQPPQPIIEMPYENGPWYVWDGAVHFGMTRPPDSYYTTGQYCAYPLRKKDLAGLLQRK